MVLRTPWKPGDEIYPQYSQVQTQPIKGQEEITKGTLYTLNADGYLEAVQADSGVVEISRGVFQAMANSSDESPTGTTETSGTRDVQVLAKPSYIIIKADANASAGDLVKIKSAAAVATPDTVSLVGVRTAPVDAIGRIVEILAYDTTSNARKRKTAAGDLVVVNTGVAT